MGPARASAFSSACLMAGVTENFQVARKTGRERSHRLMGEVALESPRRRGAAAIGHCSDLGGGYIMLEETVAEEHRAQGEKNGELTVIGRACNGRHGTSSIQLLS